MTTPIRSQEMTGKFGPSYWQGAIDAAGTGEDSKARGVGYLELTGYSEPGGQGLPQ